KKPGKTRKEQYTMPMHTAAKTVASRLNEKLSKELLCRSIPVRKGDTVKIVRGEFSGKEAKITSVNRKSRKIFVEKIVRKKSNGQEWQVPIDASNVIVIDIDRTDRKRIAKKKEEKK
ncbi:MAG: 50S ribosomal protein L24, partial [Candidatus Diapherotrites archaeon]|nr:50S ribosomal protein L24 [Candidatus Diapherotrites archaeon]